MFGKRIAMKNYVGGAASLIKVRMETNAERRTRKLKQLCELHGGVREVAEKAGLGWEGLDQIIKGVLLPPKKGSEDRSPRALGDPAARKIEEAFDLGKGWFDWPLDAVDFRRYFRLDPEDRGYAQRAMMQAIEERSAGAKQAAKRELAPFIARKAPKPATKRNTR